MDQPRDRKVAATPLGGPAIVYDGPWMQAFLSFVSGGPDIRCDFFSLHQKGSWSGAVDALPDIVSVINAAEDVARRALAVSPARLK